MPVSHDRPRPLSRRARADAGLDPVIDAAVEELRDALDRLHIAAQDVEGKHAQLDTVEALLLPSGRADDARRERASAILRSVSQSLQRTAERLQRAATPSPAETQVS